MGKSARTKRLAASDDDTASQQLGAPVTATAAEGLYGAFESLGLTPYQARVLVALLQSQSSTCLSLARLAGIPRTSIYQVLDELDSRGLACRLPGEGPAVWASVGRSDVLARLIALEEERVTQLKVRSRRVAEMLEQVMPTDRAVVLPYVHVIYDSSRVHSLLEKLLAEVDGELLVFDRVPNCWKPAKDPSAPLVGAARRVAIRLVSKAIPPESSDYSAWQCEMTAYVAAGIDARVTTDVPIPLVVFDRQKTLLCLDNPSLVDGGAPTTMLVDHPAYASVQANAFEYFWALAKPFASAAAARTESGEPVPA